MSATCEFGDVGFEIEEQIIGGNSTKIRRRALRDPTLDLKAMLLGRRDEQSKYQAQQIESKVERTVGETSKLEQGNKYRNCGREYPHSSACPAKGKTCKKCGKQNNFAAVCRGQPAQTRYCRNQRQNANKARQPRNLKTIDTKAESKSDASSEEDYLYSMTTVNRLGWLGEPANFKEKTQRAAFMSRHKGKNIT